MPLQQGSIVWIATKDQAGRNSKCRPVVILSSTHDIASGKQLAGVAATGTFSKPLPTNRIELPWKNGKHPVTGLYKPCVAVCDWIVKLDQSDIVSIGGIVPDSLLAAILSMAPIG